MLKKEFDRGRFYTRANPKGFGFEVLQALYLNEEEQEKAENGGYGRCRRTLLVRFRDKEKAKDFFESLTLEDLGTIDNTIKESLKERLPENDTEFKPQCLVVNSKHCNYQYLIKSYEDLQEASLDAWKNEKSGYYFEEPVKPEMVEAVTDEMINTAISKTIETALRQERESQARKKKEYPEELRIWELLQKADKGDGMAAFDLLNEMMEYKFELTQFSNV
jgi:hypothetical protein